MSLDAASALRFIAGLASPCVAAIQSRLATLITQLTRLADETDADAARRVAADRHWRTLVLDVRQQVEFMAREIDDGDRRRGRGMSNWRWLASNTVPAVLKPRASSVLMTTPARMAACSVEVMVTR